MTVAASALWIRRAALTLVFLTASGVIDAANALRQEKFKVLYAFGQDPNDVGSPNGTIAIDDGSIGSTGTIYGVAGAGGTNRKGGIYELVPPPSGRGRWRERVLYNFTAADVGGAVSLSGLLLQGGKLYGTSFLGGASGLGMIYELAPAARGRFTFRVIYNFPPTGGIEPLGDLAFDPVSGAIYGVTAAGATSETIMGTVFKFTPPIGNRDARVATIHVFRGSEGNAPSGINVGPKGLLYGITTAGGRTGGGLVYRLEPQAAKGKWSFEALHVLAKDSRPVANLALFSNAAQHALKVFGVTNRGGRSDLGSIYELSLNRDSGNWDFSVLHNFTGGVDGELPSAGVHIETSDCCVVALDGTATEGQNSDGTAFRLTAPNFRETSGHAFMGSIDGDFPTTTLTPGVGGALYGTAEANGLFTSGTVFAVTP